MPYGSLVTMRVSQVVSTETAAVWLSELRRVLADYAREQQSEASDLAKLRAQRAAIRAFLTE